MSMSFLDFVSGMKFGDMNLGISRDLELGIGAYVC